MSPSTDRGILVAGAVSAGIIVAVFVAEIVVVAFKGFPPTTVAEWFAVFQASRGVGLLRTFALDVAAVSLHVPLYLALYFALRSQTRRQGLLVTAVLLALIGVAVYLATNTTFSMLWLSDRYAAALTDAERSRLLGAAEAVLATCNGTGPFAAFALYSVAGILISVLMLRAPSFGRVLAILGIIGNALELGLPPSIDPPFFVKVDPLLIAAGGVVIVVWYVLIARTLVRGSSRPATR